MQELKEPQVVVEVAVPQEPKEPKVLKEVWEVQEPKEPLVIQVSSVLKELLVQKDLQVLQPQEVVKVHKVPQVT